MRNHGTIHMLAVHLDGTHFDSDLHNHSHDGFNGNYWHPVNEAYYVLEGKVSTVPLDNLCHLLLSTSFAHESGSKRARILRARKIREAKVCTK